MSNSESQNQNSQEETMTTGITKHTGLIILPKVIRNDSIGRSGNITTLESWAGDERYHNLLKPRFFPAVVVAVLVTFLVCGADR